MSQTPKICPQCHVECAPGQRFCANCGATMPDTGAPLPPTMFAPDSQSTPNNAAQNYAPPPPSNSSYPPYSSGMNYSEGSYSSGNVTPTDPYSHLNPVYQNNAAYPNQNQSGAYYPQPNQQGMNFSQPKKKSPWLYIGIGIAAAVVLCCTISFFSTNALSQHNGSTTNNTSNNNNGNDTNNNNSNATSANISNLSFVYASDQITVTSVQQAKSFKDDDETTYDSSPNYVRVSIKEQQIAKGDYSDSIFSYTSSFHLLLPDGSNVAAQNSQQDIGPKQGVVRTNWIDFPVSANINLNKLTMRVGESSEQQMDIPLQSDANLSKYQPKTITPGTQFTYAHMDWTLVSVTQSLSMGGSQAKSGKVYITVSLKANNNSNYELFLSIGGGFTRLTADGNNTAPDDLSTSMEPFDDVQPNTQNIQGTETFIAPPSSNGKYTLVFSSGGSDTPDITQQTVTFQM